ncbi:hypothetical protein QBC38DRAFT_458512 [Podospora fimiseda]|uniref:Uncharacterized protein n=1 Tax=Podospora fimiseda TaxID=252190 RepID=A0AAN7GPY1_9PEZI|nr:hypothetical protein QBC38DRAFT_458512 [Podospora fimiseda]
MKLWCEKLDGYATALNLNQYLNQSVPEPWNSSQDHEAWERNALTPLSQLDKDCRLIRQFMGLRDIHVVYHAIDFTNKERFKFCRLKDEMETTFPGIPEKLLTCAAFSSIENTGLYYKIIRHMETEGCTWEVLTSEVFGHETAALVSRFDMKKKQKRR